MRDPYDSIYEFRYCQRDSICESNVFSLFIRYTYQSNFSQICNHLEILTRQIFLIILASPRIIIHVRSLSAFLECAPFSSTPDRWISCRNITSFYTCIDQEQYEETGFRRCNKSSSQQPLKASRSPYFFISNSISELSRISQSALLLFRSFNLESWAYSSKRKKEEKEKKREKKEKRGEKNRSNGIRLYIKDRGGKRSLVEEVCKLFTRRLNDYNISPKEATKKIAIFSTKSILIRELDDKEENFFTRVSSASPGELFFPDPFSNDRHATTNPRIVIIPDKFVNEEWENLGITILDSLENPVIVCNREQGPIELNWNNNEWTIFRLLFHT